MFLIKRIVALLFLAMFIMSIPAPLVNGQSLLSKGSTSSGSQVFQSQETIVDPSLLSAVGPTRVLIKVSSALPIDEVAKYMITCRATPTIGGVYLVLGAIDPVNLSQLSSNPFIISIVKDQKITYNNVSITIPDLQTLRDALNGKNIGTLTDSSSKTDSSIGNLSPTLREVVNITGASQVWTTLGINGSGTTIALLDAGIDYGAIGLGSSAVARDNNGFPSALDADGLCMAITNLTVTTTFDQTGSRYLSTAGFHPYIYIFGSFYKWSELTGSSWPYNMNITGINSASGKYHFGIMIQIAGIIQVFPVLVVDSVTPGVYDTVYLDLSYEWYFQGYGGLYQGQGFADETPVTATGLTIATRDFTRDGYPDVSAGSLAYFLDVWGASPNPGDRGRVLQPIDPAGNYTVFENDAIGHGTFCAELAAGRGGLNNTLTGPGIAPGAKVMGVLGLYIGDIIEGWLWAAGFDLAPGKPSEKYLSGYGTVYGVWNYTGNHKADIITNSWSISEWIIESYWDDSPWYSTLTVLEDALTVPGYLDPQYPGTIITQSAGNSGPGYGTLDEPSFSTLPITVGASTSLNFSKYNGLEGGYYDDVIPFSGRGPTPLGNVKPDLINVGLAGWVTGPIWYGDGNGSNAFDLFGGTSMSTPLTAGSAALTIQAYKSVEGKNPSPEAVKLILKSTAKDLGYDAFVQGAGRVNDYAATSLALQKSGVTVSTPASWENIRPRIEYAWASSRADYGDPLNGTAPTGPLNDVGWFAGYVSPSKSSSSVFSITNPTNQTVTATITPVVHTQIQNTSYTGITKEISNWHEWGNLTVLDTALISSSTDLMVVTVTIPYSSFDSNNDYNANVGLMPFILDWVDANHNSLIEMNETRNVNYGTNLGTSTEVRMAFPLTRFEGKPVIWLSQSIQSNPTSFKGSAAVIGAQGSVYYKSLWINYNHVNVSQIV